jgi:hypothetical protein
MPMESTAKIRLTGWSRFRFYAGGFFCLLGGISISPNAFRGDIGGLFGGTLGYAFIAFGIAYAVKGRKRVRDWNAVSQWFFWAALIASGSSLGVPREHITSKEPLKPSVEAERLRQTANQLPVPEGGVVSYLKETPKTPTDAELKRVIRQSLDEILQLRRESDSERQRISLTLKKQFTVGSVDSPEAGLQMISAVQEQAALDKRITIATADWMEHTRVLVENSKLPPRIRKQLWESLNDRPELFRSRVRALNIEREWAEATISLYTFTAQNRDHITVSQGKVFLDSEALLTEYNAKFTRARERWAALLDAVREQTKIQESIEKETGTPEETLQKWLQQESLP